MRSRSLTTEQVLTLLVETPPRLAALTAGLALEELQTRPTPDEWSANEVLAHLRACADVWGNCIMAIIAEDAPTLRAINIEREVTLIVTDFWQLFSRIFGETSLIVTHIWPNLACTIKICNLHCSSRIL